MLRQLALCCVILFGLLGCKVELYSGLSEKEGNAILAVLQTHGIQVSKEPGKDQTVVLSVEEADVAAAVDILRRNGFPRDDFANLGEIFQKEGLISSPLEERVRFIYGLSQSISETLSQIDGVMTARVHIVLPEEQPLQEVVKPSSASVFIKYRPGLGIEETIPKIKMIVQNSVEGLSYDKIAVALFPAREEPKGEFMGPPLSQFLGLRVTEDSMNRFLMLLAGLGILLLLALGGNGYLMWRLKRTRNSDGETADG